MIRLVGKVLSSKVNEQTNKNGELKVTTFLNMINDKCDNIYIKVEGSTTEFDDKFIKAKVIGDDTFYNVIDNEIEIIADREDIEADMNNQFENVTLHKIMENKTNIKTLVVKTEKGKIFKVKIANSERIKTEQLKEKLIGKVFTVSYLLTSKFEKKTYYRILDIKDSIKIVK